MIYLESHNTSSDFNLALEQYVFDSMPKNDSYFMLWQNSPSIIIGKYQNTLEEINAAYVKNHIFLRSISVCIRSGWGVTCQIWTSR